MLFTKISPGLIQSSKRFVGRHPKPLKSWPNDWVPFHWSRPEHVPGYFRGGDIANLGLPTKKDVVQNAKTSLKLRELDIQDPIRRVFSLENASKQEFIDHKTQDFLKRLGIIHVVDFENSREAKIVSLTFKIRNHVETIKRLGADKEITNWRRTICNALVNRRHRYLCELKELHHDRFIKLTKALKLEPKENKINVPDTPPHRKKQMYRLTVEYCEKLKEQKVEEFIKSLDVEKQEFEKEKEETLKWIQEQKKFLGISV